MFGDDFFSGGIEDLFRRLSAGDSLVEYNSVDSEGKSTISKRMQRDVFGKVLLNKVVSEKRIYFIFNFSGKSNIHASIKDELIINDYRERVATGKKILEIKEGNVLIAEYPLSESIKVNKFESSFKNGILEVSFRK